MSTNKFLGLSVAGIKTLFTAIAASVGAADANKIISTGSDGLIDLSLMPTGIGPSTQTVTASEALAAGDFVNIYNNAGTPNVRKADASNSRPANGFVLASVANAAAATVYRQGANTALTGLTTGQIRFLSAATPGASTATPPSAAGQIVQELGYAATATSLLFEYDGYTAIN